MRMNFAEPGSTNHAGDRLRRTNHLRLASLVAILALLLAACGGDADSAADEAPAGEVSEAAADTGDSEAAADGGGGAIEIDGSSTVGPLTDAVAEEYAIEAPDVAVNVGVSGSGGGFERFCGTGDTDISNASRPIDDEEVALCEENGIEFTEVRVGTDALTMVTSPETDGISCLTTDEVTAIFGPDGVDNWSDVNPEFPDEPIEIFAPGTDSGTYDFMIEDALGIEESRQDYNASEDDNIIAQGIQGTPYSWGFFGFAYYTSNEGGVRAIEYDAGDGCVGPSVETAQDDSYGLTRPLFIYVKNESAQNRPEVADFVTFYLDIVNDVIEQVGYIPAPEEDIEQARAAVEGAISGEDASTGDEMTSSESAS